MNIQPKPQKSLILVTGASRSGKSEWAETLATQSGKPVTYIATAQVNPTDTEWQNRILRHQQRRPPHWKTLSVPIELSQTIRFSAPNECLLIDSLGTWLTNLLDLKDEAEWLQTEADLLSSLQQSPSSIVLVAEETGWGIVPAYPLGRLFRDRLGNLTRQIGAIAHPVYLVTAGYALDLTQLGQSIDRLNPEA
jgi:adenosylcobinamide kinase / adenosylcobinamide-phosphate guanylyltransferase